MHLSRLAIIGLVIYGLFLGAGLAGVGREQGSDPHKIKIVSSLPRTGSARGQTDAIVNGIRLALEEVDYKVGDFEIEYLDWDDATASAGAWTAEAESANADAAAKDPDVMVYIGTYNSGAAKISMPILNIAGLLMVSPANTAPGLTKPGIGDYGEPEIYRPTGEINFTRVVPADDLQGSCAADWAKEMGKKRVYILDDNEVYGRGVAVMFHQRCLQNGIEVLGHESIDVKAQEFKSLMTTIKGLDPDLIYFGGTTQSKGGQIAKDMANVGLDADFMGPDGCYEQAFIDSAGVDVLKGRCYVTFGGLPPEELTGKGKDFFNNYKKRFNKVPEGYAAYGYECGRVAVEAIRAAGVKDRKAIVKAALELSDIGGALGNWHFDKNGDVSLTTVSGSIVEEALDENGKVKRDKKGDKVGQFKFEKMLGKTD